MRTLEHFGVVDWSVRCGPVGAVALLGAVIFGWRSVGQQSPALSPFAGTYPIPLVAAPAQVKDVPTILNGIGTVTAFNAATIRSQVTGVPQSVDFTQGQAVKQGDRLAQIDPRPYQSRLEQAQATLARDQAKLDDTKANLARDLPLVT